MNVKSTNACPNCKKELVTSKGRILTVERDAQCYCENCGAELDSELVEESIPRIRLEKLEFRASELTKTLEKHGLKDFRVKAIAEKMEFSVRKYVDNLEANKIVSHKTSGEHKLRLGQSDNRLDLALKKLEDMSASEIVTEVRKLKAKLEQMLSEQKLPAGSAGVVIDDLTAAHSETNVKLERLAKLEEIESSAEKAEKDLSSAKETISEHNDVLDEIAEQLNDVEVEIEDAVEAYGKEKEGWEADKKYWSEHSQDPGADEFKNMIKPQYGSVDDEIVIGWQKEKKEGLEKAFAEKLKDKNQAEVEYESSVKLVENMKSEREQLRNDIKNNLKPLVKKINSLYRNFISAKKSNKVVEKSNEAKNELEELKKELGNTENQVDEHKKLLRHGIIKKTILKISMIDSTLYELSLKHNKILETLGEKDDRSTVDLDLEEYVDEFVSLPWYEERKKVRPFFIQHFNIDETKLVTDFEKQRLELEVDLAILHQQKKLLNRILVEQETTILRNESLPVEFNITRKFKEVEPERLRYITSTDTPTFDEIQPDSVLVEEFSWISTLEREFRKLIAVIFKNVNNWWTELVPDNVRYNARKHNARNEEFMKWDETQNFKLLDKLNFNAVTQIFTGNNCWEYFSPVFPKPADYQQNWLTSIKTRLIDTGYCRTRVDHSHRLDDIAHDMLKANYGFFIKYMTDFKKRNV